MAGAHSKHNMQKTESEILFMVPLSSFLIYRENSIYRPFIKGLSQRQNELQGVEPSCRGEAGGTFHESAMARVEFYTDDQLKSRGHGSQEPATRQAALGQ